LYFYADLYYGKHDGISFAPDAIKALTQYSWPGNVRELENRVAESLIEADTLEISAENLGFQGNSVRATTALDSRSENRAGSSPVDTDNIEAQGPDFQYPEEPLPVIRPAMDVSTLDFGIVTDLNKIKEKILYNAIATAMDETNNVPTVAQWFGWTPRQIRY